MNNIASYRHQISGEALTRYRLATFTVDGKVESAADSVVDALIVAVETGDTGKVIGWARSESSRRATLEIRELAHAACMAIGSEAARNFRGSFREIMGTLKRAEADLVSSLRSHERNLQAVAA